MSLPPKVSILVPNYNHRAFLLERLASIFAQTYSDYEVILLDDASTDGSVDLLQAAAQRPGVRLLINHSNSGSPFHQWNRGVEAARGEYIWIAESDDSACPEFLESLVAILDRHPSVGLAECMTLRISTEGQVLEPLMHEAYPEDSLRWTQDFLAEGREEIRRFLYLQNTIPSANAVVFRRDKYLEIGPANARMKLCGDWLQWAKILARSDRYFLAKPLAFSRIHEGTQRAKRSRNGDAELESLEVQKQIRNLCDIDRETVRQGAERYATSWIQSVRSGRYRGPFLGHASCFLKLFQSHRSVAMGFMLRFPYAIGVWAMKRTLFRRHLVE